MSAVSFLSASTEGRASPRQPSHSTTTNARGKNNNNWANVLKTYVSQASHATTNEKDDGQNLTQSQSSQQNTVSRNSLTLASSTIPKLTLKKTRFQSPLLTKLYTVAFSRLLASKRKELLSSDELDDLWALLSDIGIGEKDEDKRINYIGFQAISEELQEKYKRYFRPSIYLRFLSDDHGNISIMQFFSYVLRRASLLQARLDLSFYDEDMDGALVEDELQQYLSDIMPSLNLSTIKPSFHKFYLCTAVRKFFFFLDPTKRGKIPIRDIILSPILTELFVLREPELPKEFERNNWFSAISTLRIYGQYLSLDVDRNGMLSRKELSGYGNGSLTDVFLNRVFQECQTYNGEMDYKTFLDFVLAMENYQTPESIMFCFKMLDVNGQGYLDEFTLLYFLRAVAQKMVAFGQPMPNPHDVLNEIFDMANPKDGRQIRLEDLVKCGAGGTIVSILIDINGFYQYDNRESMS